jgi:hypothetical protein
MMTEEYPYTEADKLGLVLCALRFEDVDVFVNAFEKFEAAVRKEERVYANEILKETISHYKNLLDSK